MASPALIQTAPSSVQAWRTALDALKPGASPCPGLAGARWSEMRDAAIDFLDRFGDEAVALGWTAADLFGVHQTAGVIRVDHCGALMLNGRRVDAIGDTWISYGNQTYRRDVPGRPEGVPVWDLGR